MNLLRTVSSQLKVRLETPLSEIESRTVKKASCFRNEPFSFQVLYRLRMCPAGSL
ncbi:MAG: hypothetical protein IJO52_10065 [Clostridia bacterium]|nr:hypothetical protein [Clostridia bacterium]